MEVLEEQSKLETITAYKLSNLVHEVNAYNSNPENKKISKENIVGVLKTNDSFVLLYFS